MKMSYLPAYVPVQDVCAWYLSMPEKGTLGTGV